MVYVPDFSTTEWQKLFLENLNQLNQIEIVLSTHQPKNYNELLKREKQFEWLEIRPPVAHCCVQLERLQLVRFVASNWDREGVRKRIFLDSPSREMYI